MDSSKPQFKFSWLVYGALLIAFTYWIISYSDQIVEIVQVIGDGLWYVVAATLLVLILTIYNQARWYASIYKILNLDSEASDLLPVYLVRRFVTVAAPSGGFSGWVPFLQFARQRAMSVGTVFIANLIYTIFWYSTFLVFLFAGLVYLFIRHDLQWFEVSAGLVMLTVDVILVTGLVLAWVAPQTLHRVLGWLDKSIEKVFAGWFKRKRPLSSQQIQTFAGDLTAAIDTMRTGRRRLLIPLGHAFANETLHITMFYMVALAFGVHLHFGVLVAAYSVSILFFVVSPTPGGLGFVEGTLVLVLTSLGVRPHNATVITLAYRGITFWLPFVFGFIALRWFRQHPEEAVEEAS